ncbi:hypothetical protein [Rufibacter latericius]|uniref:hypothetical protein n=1 Tax=Rufibacter latericius TaxID=2487040 RepID=UPI0014023355|nr:hypothetical protein [Rufibacter latericius]
MQPQPRRNLELGFGQLLYIQGLVLEINLLVKGPQLPRLVHHIQELEEVLPFVQDLHKG